VSISLPALLPFYFLITFQFSPKIAIKKIPINLGKKPPLEA
jgi:hypothetical protein